MATTIQLLPSVKPSVQLTLVSSQPANFDAAFIDHRQWQQRVAEEMARGIVAEVAGAIECAAGLLANVASSQ